MKKYLLGAAVVGIALTGCVNDEAVDNIQQEKQRITFDSPVSYSNSDSRANYYGEIGNPNNTTNQANIYPTNEKFVVFGVCHTGDFPGWDGAKEIFMGTATTDDTDGKNTLSSGVEVTYNSTLNGWEPATDYFWPGGGDKLTFSAYSPADLKAYATTGQTASVESGAPTPTVTYGKNGLIIQNFKVPTNIPSHFDLLFSQRTYNQTVNGGNGTYNGVPIVFQHALASIKFELSTTSERTITLKRLELKNIRSEGDFKESIHNTDNDIDKYQATPAWENYDKVQDFVVSTENVHFKGANRNSFHSDILMLPQNLNDFNLNSTDYTPTLHVEFTIDDNTVPETRDIKLYGLDVLDATSSGTATAAEPTKITKWDMGVRYVYLLHFGDDKILFAPSAQEWKEVKYIYIDLGKETNNTGVNP